MYDPRHVAILVKFSSSPSFQDRTHECRNYEIDDKRVRVTLPKGSGVQTYSVPLSGFHVLRDPVKVATPDSHLIVIRGKVEEHATEVWEFRGAGMTWYRVFTSIPISVKGTSYWTLRPDEVDLAPRVNLGRGIETLEYLRRAVDGLPDADDPLRKPFAAMHFIHANSALATYLESGPADSAQDPGNAVPATLFPFAFNASQREAVETSLQHRISVIDGPPGTGKTQTILNLLANIIQCPGKTVGVVSFNNAAVENVREKLESQGIGFVAAGLGNREKRTAFFAAQGDRLQLLEHLRSFAPPEAVSEQELAEHAHALKSLHLLDRRLAELRERLAAFQIEQRHFESRAPDDVLPGPEELPVLRSSSDIILRYLAESEMFQEKQGRLERFIARLRGYFRYGSNKFLAPEDAAGVHRVRRWFYRRRIEELENEIRAGEETLRRAQFETVAARHQELSRNALHAGLHRRYDGHRAKPYTQYDYKPRFAEFTEDYPVILSTCHSVRNVVPEGQLLDYLIIDEASQVDLLAGALAMSICRNLIVVGDERQIHQIASEKAAARAGEPPVPAVDYAQHSILTSLIDLYGAALPRTMLREHYRCHPDIIGFCNQRFYDGQLIPYTRTTPGEEPLRVIRTAPGNHARQHQDSGMTNQREAEIAEKVIKDYFADVPPAKIGITTPYRRQVSTLSNTIGDELIDYGTVVDTVHKFQGREKDVVILSAVLDGTRPSKASASFADDEHVINVAVSRAVHQFVLITHHRDLPKSPNLRDLIGYIAYRYPENDVIDDSILSVFDLLYSEYSEKLREFASTLRGKMEYLSEDIIWTLLHDVLEQSAYAHLGVVAHVPLRDLIKDLSGLPQEHVAFVRSSAHFDFLIYNRVTKRAVLAIEVDGYTHHGNGGVQEVRDEKKNSICARRGLEITRLCTTGSDERQKILDALDKALAMPEGLDAGSVI